MTKEEFERLEEGQMIVLVHDDGREEPTTFCQYDYYPNDGEYDMGLGVMYGIESFRLPVIADLANACHSALKTYNDTVTEWFKAYDIAQLAASKHIPFAGRLMVKIKELEDEAKRLLTTEGDQK